MKTWAAHTERGPSRSPGTRLMRSSRYNPSFTIGAPVKQLRNCALSHPDLQKRTAQIATDSFEAVVRA